MGAAEPDCAIGKLVLRFVLLQQLKISAQGASKEHGGIRGKRGRKLRGLGAWKLFVGSSHAPLHHGGEESGESVTIAVSTRVPRVGRACFVGGYRINMPPIKASAVLLDHRVQSCQFLPVQRGINGIFVLHLLLLVKCRPLDVRPQRSRTKPEMRFEA